MLRCVVGVPVWGSGCDWCCGVLWVFQCGGQGVTGVAVWGSGCDWCCSVGVGRNRLCF